MCQHLFRNTRSALPSLVFSISIHTWKPVLHQSRPGISLSKTCLSSTLRWCHSLCRVSSSPFSRPVKVKARKVHSENAPLSPVSTHSIITWAGNQIGTAEGKHQHKHTRVRVCVCERGTTCITARGGELTPAVTDSMAAPGIISSLKGALKDGQSSWEEPTDHDGSVLNAFMTFARASTDHDCSFYTSVTTLKHMLNDSYAWAESQDGKEGREWRDSEGGRECRAYPEHLSSKLKWRSCIDVQTSCQAAISQ